MSGYKFDRTISAGNLMQAIILIIASLSFFFGLRSSVAANSLAIQQNSKLIEKIERKTDSVDVLNTRIDHLDEQLDRIECKLDE